MEGSYEFMKILSIEEAVKTATGKKVIIITGVTGQDGSFMADYLLKNTDYELFGGARRLSVNNHENIDHLEYEKRFHLINFDLTDAHSIAQIISQLHPHYFINFAAQSFVKSSWDFPAQTWDTNTTSMIHILESIRLHCPICRFYNAGSSEEFGDAVYTPQDEKHPLRPRSPYGASKAAARQLVKVYRESYGLYAIQGWLFNHEGSRRGEEFVTRKITKGVAEIAKRLEDIQIKDTQQGGNSLNIVPLELGNLDALRDWSDAEDFVDAVWRMLNQEKYNAKFNPLMESFYQSRFSGPFKDKDYLELSQSLAKNIKEYVISSNENHSVREFVEESFRVAGIQGKWMGEGTHEIFGDEQYGILARINPIYYRPAEVNALCGDSSLARKELGWKPTITFKQLVKKMVLNDLK
jgi:GDPmannose 4,6-dehydratase